MAESLAPTTKVLCLFRYWGKHAGEVFSCDDGIMIEVEFADQILDTFNKAIVSAKRRFGGWPVGPTPRQWELTGYIPETPLVRSARDLH